MNRRLAIAAARRAVVVSPHLDDAVLSLGASIARATRAGSAVDVVTVLACDPDSTAASKGWDARAGFATEGEAARARRSEDADACAALGATPVWLPFGSIDYERHGEDEDIRRRVLLELGDADLVLLPGSPLSHPDHSWLVRLLVAGGLPGRIGFFLEQPYALRMRTRATPEWLTALASGARFEPTRAGARAWLAKLHAVRRYRSQLPLLGLADRPLRLERHLWSEVRAGGEAVAWLQSGAAGSRP